MTKILITGLVAVAMFAITMPVITKGNDATTRLSLEERRLNSIRSCISDAHGLPKECNVFKVEDEQIIAVKAATPETLRKPVVIASRYLAKTVSEKGYLVFLTWLEDQPTLRSVTVRNPETEEKMTIAIPLDHLEDAAKDDEPTVFLYRWIARIPANFLGDPSQALEISAPDQEVPATCYPSVPFKPKGSPELPHEP